MFTKIFAIIIIAWFYKSAEKLGENKIQWAIVGFIGYCIFVALAHIFVAKPLLDYFYNQAMWLSFSLGHLPMIIGIIATIFIRIRLIRLAKKAKETTQ